MDIEKRNELVEFLMELRDDEGELKSKLKALREEIEGIETELIESMVETENLTFKYKNATITVYMTERVSPEPDCKDDLWAAFRKESERLIDEGETGYEGLFTINPQTLQGTVKDLKANNDDRLPEWLNGLVKIYDQPGLRITKGKKQ